LENRNERITEATILPDAQFAVANGCGGFLPQQILIEKETKAISRIE
jgi:hypothetical protein